MEPEGLQQSTKKLPHFAKHKIFVFFIFCASLAGRQWVLMRLMTANCCDEMHE
jgi:hypothetical protein